MNADSIMKTGTPLGTNVFAYCGNNPVNFVDYDGRVSQKIAKIIVEIITVFVAINTFVEYIFNDEVILEFSNYEKDKNGMYMIKIKYQKPKNLPKSLTVYFGGYIEWLYSKNTVNSNNSMQIEHYGTFIEEHNVLTGSIDPNPGNMYNGGDDYAPVFMSVFLGLTLAYYGIKTIPIRKVFDAVWGENGLDANNSLCYWVYRVTYDSQYNGSYAYSFNLNKWVKL